MMKTTIPFLVLLFFCAQCLFAQQDVFKIGLLAGANVAQIGTANGGFYSENDFFQKTHHGLNAGLMATMQVSVNSSIGVEFLFSQNGKYLKSAPIYENQNVDIFINYLEIPIHYNWQSNISRKTEFNNFHFEAGVAYARLLTNNSKFVRNKIEADSEFFNKDRTLLLQTGMSLFITKKFGLNFRVSAPVDSSWTGMTVAGRWFWLFR